MVGRSPSRLGCLSERGDLSEPSRPVWNRSLGVLPAIGTEGRWVRERPGNRRVPICDCFGRQSYPRVAVTSVVLVTESEWSPTRPSPSARANVLRYRLKLRPARLNWIFHLVSVKVRTFCSCQEFRPDTNTRARARRTHGLSMDSVHALQGRGHEGWPGVGQQRRELHPPASRSR